MDKPRPEVQWFAEQMEERLRANDHKGGWQDNREADLFKRVVEELGEVYDLVGPQDTGHAAITHHLLGQVYEFFDSTFRRFAAYDRGHAIRELADVANFLMMIADNLRREAEERLRGEEGR